MELLCRLALLGVSSAAALAGGEASDSIVLAQWTYRVSPALLEAEPLEGSRQEVLAPSPQAAPAPSLVDGAKLLVDVLESLPDFLNQTVMTNATFKSSSSRRPAEMDAKAMQQMLEGMNALMDAVRQDDFMGNMTWLIKETVSSARENLAKNLAALDKYDFWSRTAQDKEMPGLTIWFFNNLTNNTLDMETYMKKAINMTKAAVPQKLVDMMEIQQKQYGVTASTSMQDVDTTSLTKLMAGNATRAEVCYMADRKLKDMIEMLSMVQKAQKMFDGMKTSMISSFKHYLQSMRPEVEPRVMFLVQKMMDEGYAVMTESLESSQKVVDGVTPVIKARMGCKLASSGSSRAGLGLLALALLFVARLEL